MDDHDIVIKPLITEQSTHFANEKNAYAFEVNSKANKIQIKGAVERLYGVKVTDVRTANRKGKPKRRGRFMGKRSDWKKAVVVLDEQHHIDLF
ncbi:MAG: 50S ribosomal protein L23 [Sedimentisphaerales bacterium]|nr:MAG: 50S ribosomal protein L23 [Planctomycetes bacterium GWC2_45_44]HBG78842.1 50S ribosomal protein L23 [Phycisphaerales bacterium]HBR20502.1 50S ribosomal protein L23 [Phycisphaerales bacterium]